MDSERNVKPRKVINMNRKQRTSGAFQSFGLDHIVLKGILKRGYQIPTPIQRKAIPLILNGKDVVAMARTGSGKTAAFIVPMLQKLKCRSPKAGARAILISPTRELALQTLKFTKDLCRFGNFKIATLIGGDNMEEQFAAIHENPDIIIATPGRLLHVAVEMNLKLKSVEYLVFDEADRLFEMGFEEQLKDVIRRLPDDRQTLLFSATLPKNLVDFAKFGLNEPVLVRLDVDNKISDKLNSSFLLCRFEDKLAVLFHLLHHIIDVEKEQTIIFCSTKHHVEYLKDVLTKASFKCSYVYSSLDSTARKNNIEKFRKKHSSLLIVTDLAARGIDIPLLDNVVNFHFPAKSKLFVHRVGRVARAGQDGRAFSIVTSEELPYVTDLYLFLGRSLTYLSTNQKIEESASDLVGAVPQSAIDAEDEHIRRILDGNSDLDFLRQGANNSFKKYIQTRPIASRESVERVKKDKVWDNLAYHPIFKGESGIDEEAKRLSVLDELKHYKPQATVFELNAGNKHQSCLAMKAKRKAHQKFVVDRKKEIHPVAPSNLTERFPIETCSENDIKNVFLKIIDSKCKQKCDANKSGTKNKKESNASKDKDYFVPYKPSDYHSESGLLIEKSGFEREAGSAVVDFTSDDVTDMRKQKNKLKWDRKRKKYVRDNEEGKAKKIRTESGVWIPATYKTDIYDKWKQKSKIDNREERSDDEENPSNQNKSFGPKRFQRGRQMKNGPASNELRRGSRKEIKPKEIILKERRRKEKIHAYQNFKRQKGSNIKTNANRKMR